MMEVVDYGKEKLSCGPAIDESDEIIIVEGRADVLNLLKHGFKNAIAMNGTSCPDTIKELAQKKTATVFVDGDRGGDLIIRELLSVTDIDFVCKAPDGKEVEEITKKEIHKALRGRITAEQAKLDLGVDSNGSLKEEINKIGPSAMSKGQFQSPRRNNGPSTSNIKNDRSDRGDRPERTENRSENRPDHRNDNRSNDRYGNRPQNNPRQAPRETRLSADEKKKFKQTLEDLFGTRGACIFDSNLNILGKVPLSELETTIKSLNGGIHALVLDGTIDIDLVKLAERIGIVYLVGTNSKVKEANKINILTDEQL